MYEYLKRLYEIGRTVSTDKPIKLTEAQLRVASAKTQPWITAEEAQQIIDACLIEQP